MVKKYRFSSIYADVHEHSRDIAMSEIAHRIGEEIMKNTKDVEYEESPTDMFHERRVDVGFAIMSLEDYYTMTISLRRLMGDEKLKTILNGHELIRTGETSEGKSRET